MHWILSNYFITAVVIFIVFIFLPLYYGTRPPGNRN